jgi:hypothetical protein
MTDSMSADEYRRMGRKKRSKFGNKKGVHSSGKVFDSLAEMRRYDELLLLERAGEISHLETQPPLELQPKFKRGRKTIREITYLGDFKYIEDGQVVIEDVKGTRTAVFNLKWKMAQYHYPHIDFRLVYMKKRKRKR